MSDKPEKDLSDENVIYTETGQEFTVGEIKHSKRIQKSATPKGTFDWYIKWFGSTLLIMAVAMRSSNIPELHIWDMILSMVGIACWGTVGFIWKDRALVVLNSVMFVMLVSGTLEAIFGS